MKTIIKIMRLICSYLKTIKSDLYWFHYIMIFILNGLNLIYSELLINDTNINIQIHKETENGNMNRGMDKKIRMDNSFILSSNRCNNNINYFNNSNKLLISRKFSLNKNKGGYLSYYKQYVMLGSIINILDDNKAKYFEERFTEMILEKLEEGKIYRMLITVKYEEDGEIKGSTPMRSVMITKSISVYLILDRIQRELRKFEYEYNLEDYTGECYVGWKEWLSNEEFVEGVTSRKVDEVVSEILQDELKNKHKQIKDKMIDGDVFNYINKMFPKFNSVDIYPRLFKKTHMSSDNDQLIRKLFKKYHMTSDNDQLIRKDIEKYLNDFNNDTNILIDNINNTVNNIKYKINNVYLVKYKDKETLLFVYECIKNNGHIVRYNCLCDYNSWNIVKMT